MRAQRSLAARLDEDAGQVRTVRVEARAAVRVPAGSRARMVLVMTGVAGKSSNQPVREGDSTGEPLRDHAEYTTLTLQFCVEDCASRRAVARRSREPWQSGIRTSHVVSCHEILEDDMVRLPLPGLHRSELRLAFDNPARARCSRFGLMRYRSATVADSHGLPCCCQVIRKNVVTDQKVTRDRAHTRQRFEAESRAKRGHSVPTLRGLRLSIDAGPLRPVPGEPAHRPRYFPMFAATRRRSDQACESMPERSEKLPPAAGQKLTVAGRVFPARLSDVWPSGMPLDSPRIGA